MKNTRKIVVILALTVTFSFMIIAINSTYVWAEDNCGIAPIEQTGQTTSYAPGDDGDLQMGIPWPNPRFMDNGDGTVTDNLTGLIWLKNANCPNEVKSWGDAITFANSLYDGWTGDGTGGDCDLSDGSVAGDWRLPNAKELLSLVDYGISYVPGTPVLPSDHPFARVQSAGYWSSTTFEGFAFRAWYVSMNIPETSFGDKAANSLYVWPVRGISGPCVCVASTMHIESIIAGTDPAKGKWKYGKATVTILDDCGSPVSGVDVTGTFTGDYNETITGTSGSDGIAVLTTSAYVKKPLYQFCVDDVNHETLKYEPNDNVEVCKTK